MCIYIYIYIYIYNHSQAGLQCVFAMMYRQFCESGRRKARERRKAADDDQGDQQLTSGLSAGQRQLFVPGWTCRSIPFCVWKHMSMCGNDIVLSFSRTHLRWLCFSVWSWRDTPYKERATDPFTGWLRYRCPKLKLSKLIYRLLSSSEPDN